MLNTATVTANIPASDLQRARAFYADVLGLEPVGEVEGIMALYRMADGSRLSIYETRYAGQAGHTLVQFHVDDVVKQVDELRAKGVQFEHYDDMPGVTWDGDVASMGDMGQAAWFTDCEGNILCLDSGFPAP